MSNKLINFERLVLVPPGPDDGDVSSAVPYYALIVRILDSLREKDPTQQKSFEKSIVPQLKQLKKIADDNSEEGTYLLNEIEGVSEIKLDSYLISTLDLAKWEHAPTTG